MDRLKCTNWRVIPGPPIMDTLKCTNWRVIPGPPDKDNLSTTENVRMCPLFGGSTVVQVFAVYSDSFPHCCSLSLQIHRRYCGVLELLPTTIYTAKTSGLF